MDEKIWHSLSWQEVVKFFESDTKNGLSPERADFLLKKNGKNKLPEERHISGWKLFFYQLRSPLIYILAISGLIVLFLGEYSEAIIIFIIVLLNALIGFFQENKTSQILKALKRVMTVKAFVLRDGEEKEIEQVDLVIGDIILLHPGNKVPADARLVEEEGLAVNEMALTGEWIPSKKSVETLPRDSILAERKNMVFMSTIVEEGVAKAIVVATGLNTEIGKIASGIKEVFEEKTPYQIKTEKFSKVLAIVVLLLSFFIFLWGISIGEDPYDIFLMAVAVAVASIPEGLPVAMTLIFAFGVRELLAKKGLVRRLVAAETLGSTSVICTDKTGTLTEAKMEVKGIYTTHGEVLHNMEVAKIINGSASHILALKIATLRSEAFIENFQDPMEEWIARGRPTDRALFLAGVQAGLNKKKVLEEEEKIDELIFDPNNKYSASLHRFNDKEDIIYIMGAPERILDMSKFVELEDGTEDIGFHKMKELKEKYSLLTSQGFRIIAVAYKKVLKDKMANEIARISNKEEKENIYGDYLNDSIFVGFISLHDPLRKNVKEAMETCRMAGMKPIIVTGDHKLTAKAIAMELGFLANEDNILEGRELDVLSDEEFYKICPNIEIYARVEPRHKIKIIEAWQKRGEVVAMTGDGINDALALKKANIGVALGSGTDVAKESADLILLSDNFEVIVLAVQEGRRIIDNIRKIITYLLVGAFTEVMLIMMSLVFHLPLPFLPGQLLWKNVIESTPPSFAFAFEPKEDDVMKRPPEALNSQLITPSMGAIIFYIGIFTNFILFWIFIWLLNQGFALEKIRTIMFAGIAFDSFFFIFSLRNLKKNIWQYNPFANGYITLAAFLGFALLAIAIYVPFFQNLLKTTAIGWFEWKVLLGFGVLNLVLIEATKFYFDRKHVKISKNHEEII